MQQLKTIFSHITCFLLLGLLLHCKDSSNITDTIEIDHKKEQSLTTNDLEQITYVEYALSDLSIEKTKDWLKFKTLQQEIDNLKKGNLLFFTEDKDILTGFINDLKKEIPKNLDSSSIKVRLTVLETALYKLEEAYNLNNSSKETVIKNIESVLISFNNLVFQINKKTEKDAINIVKPQ